MAVNSPTSGVENIFLGYSLRARGMWVVVTGTVHFIAGFSNQPGAMVTDPYRLMNL
jgi:hypothetical protein